MAPSDISLDTRAKIVRDPAVAAALLAQPGDARIAAGVFDPLIAAHIEQLAALRASLIVVVRDRADALLGLRARAELVAGLAMVRHVVMAPEGALPPETVILEETQIRDGLFAHVKERYRG